MKYLKIYTDGGARGNPGPAAYGLVIKNQKENIIYKYGEKIGKATNNQAEYEGLIAGLKWLVKKNVQPEKIDFFLDSTLVVNQMQGNFKVKSLNIRPLWRRAKKLEDKIDAKINYHHIPREKNTEADKMLNEALDK
jgi:ribonuclease HI